LNLNAHLIAHKHQPATDPVLPTARAFWRPTGDTMHCSNR